MALNVESIKKDIIKMPEKDFYFKYIIKSYNWYFTEYQGTPDKALVDKMDHFKEIISTNFNVSFHSAQIVGSAKLGLSLSPKKHFREFIGIAKNDNERESDIDVAIVSEKLFETIWNQIRISKKSDYVPRYQKIACDVFNGYINDKDFKEIESMRKLWEEKISNSNIKMQDDLSISHPISYRIYRSWEDLEEYQLGGIKLLKEEVIHEV